MNNISMMSFQKSSTTICLFIAQNLPENKRVRVVTNSIIIAEELRSKEHISVILLGGEMDNKGNCFDAFVRLKDWICSLRIVMPWKRIWIYSEKKK